MHEDAPIGRKVGTCITNGQQHCHAPSVATELTAELCALLAAQSIAIGVAFLLPVLLTGRKAACDVSLLQVEQ